MDIQVSVKFISNSYLRNEFVNLKYEGESNENVKTLLFSIS